MAGIFNAINRDVRKFGERKNIFDGELAEEIQQTIDSVVATGMNVDVHKDLTDLFLLRRESIHSTKQQKKYHHGKKRV